MYYIQRVSIPTYIYGEQKEKKILYNNNEDNKLTGVDKSFPCVFVYAKNSVET